jgi:hypothetical protein
MFKRLSKRKNWGVAMYDEILELFNGVRSLSIFLIENFSQRDSESSQTYSCSNIFIQLDGQRLLNISGTAHYITDIRDEAFGLEVKPGWFRFTMSGKPPTRIEFSNTYYNTPDFSELWQYISLDNCKISVEVEALEEELAGPYSEDVESVEVIKAIIIKSPKKTVFIGQGSTPYELIVTTDKRKMQWVL